MPKYLYCFLAFLLAARFSAAQPAGLTKINEYFNTLFSQPFSNIDTSYIAYRAEASALIASEDQQMKSNGYKVLGLLNLYADNYEQSIKDLRRAIALDSSCSICYIKLHWIYFFQKNNFAECGRIRQAGNRNMEKLVRADSLNAASWDKLYRVYELAPGKRPKKIEDRMSYAAAKLVGLDSANAYYWWQYSLHTSGSAQEKALVKAVDLEPAQSVYWNALAYCYVEQKSAAKMKEVMEKSKPSGEDDLSYWYQQNAHFHHRLGLTKEAAAIAKEAREKGITIVYK